MKIRPSEIVSIEEIGELDGSPVRLLRTSGGLFMATGKLKGKASDEALAAGSHPAIVKYNLEKQHRSFRPAMNKSETNHEEVIGLSELLPAHVRSQGYDLYEIRKSEGASYFITKFGSEVSSYKTVPTDSTLKIEVTGGPLPAEASGAAHGVMQAAAREAVRLGKQEIEFQKLKIPAQKLGA